MEPMYIYANARQMRLWLEDSRQNKVTAKVGQFAGTANCCNCNGEDTHDQHPVHDMQGTGSKSNPGL